MHFANGGENDVRRTRSATLGLVCVALACAGSAASATTTFMSSNDDVRCQTGVVGETTGVMCIRYSDDRGFTLLPTRQRWYATVADTVPYDEMNSGWVLWPGQSRNFRYPDATYRCTARSASVIRCTYTKYGYGFQVGRGFLMTF